MFADKRSKFGFAVEERSTGGDSHNGLGQGDTLRPSFGRGLADDDINRNVDLLFSEAWSKLERMKNLQDEMTDRLEIAKKIVHRP